MASIKVVDMSGKEVGSIELNDSIFAVEINEHVMHQAVVQYLANQRQGTQSTLTRAEVRGGGRKPWRQKGTGRARQGSIRSPQWMGGGVVFAPKPRDYSFKVNKKVKRLALKSALTSKLNDASIIVVDDVKVDEIKTKTISTMLTALDAKKALLVLENDNKNAVLAARNIPTVKTASPSTINVYDILKYDKFVVTKTALEKIEEVYA